MVIWVGSAAVILWAATTRLADPNESPRWEESHSPLSIALWRGKNLSLQAVQLWAEGKRPSHDGPLLVNEFSERRVEVDIATSQSSMIGREVKVAFFCALLDLLKNFGTWGSSALHRCMATNMETMSARSSSPLCMARRSRISLGEMRA